MAQQQIHTSVLRELKFSTEIFEALEEVKGKIKAIEDNIKTKEIWENNFRFDQVVINKKIEQLRQELGTITNRTIGCELQILNKNAQSFVPNFGKLIRDPSRERKVLIHGLLPVNGNLALKVMDFFEEALEIKPAVLSVKIRKSKRTGYQFIEVTLKCHFDKARIFYNCHKLRKFPKKISIVDDLNEKERNLRRNIIATKKLQNNLKQDNLEESGFADVSLTLNSDDDDISSGQPKQKHISVVHTIPETSTQNGNKDKFLKDEIVLQICRNLQAKIGEREEKTKHIGLIARVASINVIPKSNCDCKRKIDKNQLLEYIKTKYTDENQLNWLLNRLKDGRHDLKRRWIALFGDDNNCYCFNISLERLLLTDLT